MAGLRSEPSGPTEFPHGSAAVPRWAAPVRPGASRGLVIGGVALFVLSACVSYGVFLHDPALPLAERTPALAAIEIAVALPDVALGPPQPLEPTPASSPGESSELMVLTGRVPKGGTLASALGKDGVSPRLIHDIARGMRPVFDFRRAHAGDFFALIRSRGGEILSFEYRRGRSVIYKANYDTVRKLVLFLMQDCCAGNNAVCRPVAESLAINA